MATIKRHVRDRGWRIAARFAPTVTASIAKVPQLQEQSQEVQRLRERVESLEREVQEAQQLSRRVKQLEDEVQEMRRLNRRVAEVTDVVEELLLPAADRDEERVRHALRDYASSL